MYPYPFINYKTKLKPETLEELSLTEFEDFWRMISRDQILSEQFIEKHSDKLDLCYIVEYQVLSEPFIEKHEDKLNWDYISRYQNLSLEFMIKHKDKINLYYLIFNRKIFQKTKDKFLEITNKNI